MHIDVKHLSGLFLSVVIILLILTQSTLFSMGRKMRAIRDNEEAAGAMGKNVVKEHLLIFIRFSCSWNGWRNDGYQ